MNDVLRVLLLKPRDHPRFSTFRVDAFTDAVYAIAATILILEIRPPDVSEGQLGAALLHLWPHHHAVRHAVLDGDLSAAYSVDIGGVTESRLWQSTLPRASSAERRSIGATVSQ